MSLFFDDFISERSLSDDSCLDEYSLEFPTLEEDRTNGKRSLKYQSHFPKKRKCRWSATRDPVKVIDSDQAEPSISLVESVLPGIEYPDVFFDPIIQNQKDAITQTLYEVSNDLKNFTPTQALSSPRVVEASSPLPMLAPNPDHVVSLKQNHHTNSVPMIQPQRAEETHGNFTASMLKTSQEPMLLTLTSFPFRVIYANDSYTDLCGEVNVGKAFFDLFHQEGPMKPSLALFPTLLKKFQNAVVCLSSADKKGGVLCKIKAYPVMKKNQTNDLRYYAVKFTKLENSATYSAPLHEPIQIFPSVKSC